jgi:Spy/CpxP family protein refolding chaperone
MTKRWLFAALALLIAGSAFAADLPPGKWWRRPEIVQALSLTEDQQNRLETIFRDAAPDLIDLRATVDKEAVSLRGALDQPQLDRAGIRRIAARLSEARGRLFERELTMLVDMRGVLSDTQWQRMRAQLDRQETQPRLNPQRRRQ